MESPTKEKKSEVTNQVATQADKKTDAKPAKLPGCALSISLGENTACVGYCNIVFGDNQMAKGEYKIAFSEKITLTDDVNV